MRSVIVRAGLKFHLVWMAIQYGDFMKKITKFFRLFLSTIFIFAFTLIATSINAMALARGKTPEIRFCDAAATYQGDNISHFFSIDNGSVAFCEFGIAAIGYQTLFDRVEKNSAQSYAVQSYLRTIDCGNGGDCFVCNQAVNGCDGIFSGQRVDGNGQDMGAFYYYRFADGSVIGKVTLDMGVVSNNSNQELTDAIGLRNLPY